MLKPVLRYLDSGCMSKLLGEKTGTDTNIFKEAVLPVSIRVD
jgi:hypothetical protein